MTSGTANTAMAATIASPADAPADPATMPGAYSAARASGPPNDVTATPAKAQALTGRAAGVRGRGDCHRCGRPQPPPAFELPDVADAAGAGAFAGAAAGAAAAAAVSEDAVISAPEEATSHHLAPKLSLPWPLVCPAAESPTK